MQTDRRKTKSLPKIPYQFYHKILLLIKYQVCLSQKSLHKQEEYNSFSKISVYSILPFNTSQTSRLFFVSDEGLAKQTQCDM